MTKGLYLPLKREYFEAIKSGEKKEEYRLYNAYWRKRIEDKKFGFITLTLGYPKKTEINKILIRQWWGYTIKTIKHKHFGDKPVKVFAIKVN